MVVTSSVTIFLLNDFFKLQPFLISGPNVIQSTSFSSNFDLKSCVKLLSSSKKYRIDFLKNGKKNQMGIYDNNKLVIKGDYNFYGIYQPYTNLWIWASSIPGVDKKHIKNIKKIKASDYLFEEDTDPKISFYYQLLTQDVILITNEQMISWINELLLYLSNDLFYFNPINSDQNIQFITLTNTKEKYI